jgi:predicted enzyme related to lactoylglutathione lyase
MKTADQSAVASATACERDANEMPSAVTHFEIYAEEPAKLAEFYRTLLGWQVDKAPGIDYWRINTAPGEDHAIGGGLTFRPIQGPRSWVHYLHVQSLDHTLDRLLELGGTQVRPKTAVPKAAWYAVVADPEGNIFAIWQADPLAMPLPEPDELG